jgi:hypothetical protein
MSQLIANAEIKSIIVEYRDIDLEIKKLEAELKQLKTLLLEGYIKDYHEVATTQGLVLCTYKPYDMAQFQQSKFKEENIELYKQYSEIKTIRKFDLKKFANI